MPAEKEFMAKKSWVSAEELCEISSKLVVYGIDEIRLTGGEPLLRPDFRAIVKRLDQLPLSKFGLTTNGIHLERELDFLKDTSLRYLNISLDSLNKENFEKITQTNTFSRVYHSIVKAHSMGFKVKVNAVLLRGMNDTEDELSKFVEFTQKTGIEVRFLELMRIGVANNYFEKYFISAGEVIDRLKLKNRLEEKEMPKDSTSFNFYLPKGGEIGFIASESRPFCGHCSRLRLGADGALRPCLFMDHGVSLRGLKGEDFLKTLKQTIKLKPHDRIKAVNQAMHQIGG
tara:strand:+ start:1224 stop:2081 length:858 start_codon:yes stop_codon:yes gene_type:complete